MRHKEWKMGTMVEKIQLVGPSNLSDNMVNVFANTGNTLPPGNLRTFGVRHESTALCRWGVFQPKKLQQRLTVEELWVPVLHPKFFQCFCICTHPCNLGTHTGGLTPFHPPLDTTTLAIVRDGVQRVCQILRHGETTPPLHSGVPQQQGQNQKSKPTLGVTMMLLVSQTIGL